jgi:hypothetical protein
MAEGEGYLAFAEAGVPTPRLLGWGEARRLGFWTQGLVVTQAEPLPTVAEHFKASGDLGALQRAMACLALIHQCGLAHGDARLRNFLIDEQRVLAFDLCSWRGLGKSARVNDLVRFLGSCQTLTGAEAVAELLAFYRRTVRVEMPVPAVLEAARAYANLEREP